MTITPSVPPVSVAAQGLFVLAVLAAAPQLAAAQANPTDDPTFTKDIAPILQRSCQKCHRPNSLAPMSLITYEEVRPWARSIKQRTGLRNRMGVMPPWYIEKDIGIQRFKDDWSLSDENIATIATWADAGAPRGNPADMPAPPAFIDVDEWEIGQPDLIVSSTPIEVPGLAPDWWGTLGEADSGLTEDRYVAAIEYKERNDMQRGVRSDTVGGLFVVHHSALTTMGPDDGPRDAYQWPVHEVGRNADIFDEEAGPLLKAGSKLIFPSTHLHSNGTDTTAWLEVGFKFHPKEYEPTKEVELLFFGNGPDIDIRGLEDNQRMDAYFTLPENTKVSVYEPHMHAPGVRMCLDAVWGTTVQTLNCSGYDHNWVRVYKYEDDAAPLLPKGTILHLTGYFNNSLTNPNVPDPRNWSGSGHRSVDNMFINLLQAIYMDDDEFSAEVTRREEMMRATGVDDIGCLLCGADTGASTTGGGQ
ncbi:MAG: hypothetical protein QF681_09425 [Vicinamibacterales bacterium]|jgi:hypothetical protein|nr:hypothetical protein [Vicinamibacterales bacterium]